MDTGRIPRQMKILYKSLPKCCYYERYVKPSPIRDTDSLHLSMEERSYIIHHYWRRIGRRQKGKMLPLSGATIRCLHSEHTEFDR